MLRGGAAARGALLTPASVPLAIAVPLRATLREAGACGAARAFTAGRVLGAEQKPESSSSTPAEAPSGKGGEKTGGEKTGGEVAHPEKPRSSMPVRMMRKVKEEALHYWHGFKLLAKEVSISTRLVKRLIMGYSLTRREYRQLRRTTADMLRLIPFIPFIIIPAAELLLPVAVKLFPNMLPSTFESKFAQEEKRRRLLRLRLEMAKFLQETIKEGGLQVSDQVKDSDAFKTFFRKVRATGESPSPHDVIQVAKLFDDDMTLDNLTRPQLVSICRYIQVNAFGTDNFLRFQIRSEMNRIRRDDLVINDEGTESMSYHELVSACQQRGIWTVNVPEEKLRESLDVWINLHIRQKISGTLLILSRAFYYAGRPAEPDASVADTQLRSLELTLSSLPETLLNEAELHFSKEAASNKQRLEVLQEQEDLIEDEAEQEQEELAAREAAKERKSAEKDQLATESAEARTLLPQGEGAAGKATGAQDKPAKDEDDVRMTQEQLSELGEALRILSAKSSVLREREDLRKMMGELPGDERAAEAGKEEKAAKESSAYTALNKRIRSMLERLDQQLEEYDHDVGSRMHLIQTSSTGKISAEDLEQALRLIKHRPDEASLQKLVDKLDVDLDGLVPLDDVLELAQAESGLGIVRDNDDLRDIQEEGKRLIDGEHKPQQKPRKQDIVEE